MMATPQLPTGTECLDGWQPSDGNDRTYRIISGIDRKVDGVGVIGTTAVQFDDGTIDTDEPPQIWLGLGGDGVPTDKAREVAFAILSAADEADGWVDTEAETAADAVLVVDESGEKIEIACHPFEPDAPDYDGERYVGIFYCGKEESFAVLSRAQAARLSRLLMEAR